MWTNQRSVLWSCGPIRGWPHLALGLASLLVAGGGIWPGRGGQVVVEDTWHYYYELILCNNVIIIMIILTIDRIWEQEQPLGSPASCGEGDGGHQGAWVL